jgi:hypothetical protein
MINRSATAMLSIICAYSNVRAQAVLVPKSLRIRTSANGGLQSLRHLLRAQRCAGRVEIVRTRIASVQYVSDPTHQRYAKLDLLWAP